MLKIITGESKISLRIIDWFVTNYAKKNFTVYNTHSGNNARFKVFYDYKLKLKAYCYTLIRYYKYLILGDKKLI